MGTGDPDFCFIHKKQFKDCGALHKKLYPTVTDEEVDEFVRRHSQREVK